MIALSLHQAVTIVTMVCTEYLVLNVKEALYQV